MGHITTTFASMLLAAGLTACADGVEDQADGTSTSTSPEPTTTTTTSAPPGAGERCENPEGFTVVPPEGWAVNDGAVTGPCSQFDPEPFEVPQSTDERVAAITAYVDPVPYAEVASLEQAGGVDRAVTAIDGRQAVRLAYEVDDDGLHPPGTPITLYAVDLTGTGGPATLFLDTVGTAPFNYEANVRALDRMVRTLDVTAPGVAGDPSIVATFVGGGGGFSVAAEHREGETCLRVPPEGQPACADDPTSDQAHTIALVDLERELLAGVTGAAVWRVDAHEGENSTVHSSLATPVPGTDLGAFALTVRPDAVQRLVLRDIDGTEIGVAAPGA